MEVKGSSIYLKAESDISVMKSQSMIFKATTAPAYTKISSALKTEFPVPSLIRFASFLGTFLVARVIISYDSDQSVLTYSAALSSLISLIMLMILVISFIDTALDILAYFATNKLMEFDETSSAYIYFIFGTIENYSVLLAVAFGLKSIPSIWGIISMDIFFHKCANAIPGFMKIYTIPDFKASGYEAKDMSETLKQVVVFILYLGSFINKVSSLILIYLAKELFIVIVTYSIHTKKYFKKIEDNERRTEVLLKINELNEIPPEESIIGASDKIFDTWADETDKLDYRRVTEQLGEDRAALLFAACNTDGQQWLEREAFLNYYKKTLAERKKLIDRIQSQSASLENFRLILNIFVFVISILVVFLFPNITDISDLTKTLILPLFSGAYIFSSFISEIINSILFIFFKRCFEIGDIIIVDDKEYKVQEINILTTVLLDDTILCTIPNDSLRSKNIRNITESKNYLLVINLSFNAKEFKELEPVLVDHLNDYYNTFPSLLTNSPFISNCEIVSFETFKITITANFYFELFAIDTLKMKRNQFLLDLHAIFDKIGLHPIQK